MALTTPIPQIELALGGLVDFTIKKSGGTPKKDEPPKDSPAAAAQALAGFLRKRKKEGADG